MGRWTRILAGGLLGLTQCTAALDPPALPDPVTVFEGLPIGGALVVPLPQPVDEVELVPDRLPVVLPSWSKPPARRAAHDAGDALALQQVSLPPSTPGGERETRELEPAQRLVRPAKPENPETVLREAMHASLIAPSSQAHFGGSAITRYPYHPDKVYQVFASPQKPVLLILPLGERLAADPMYNTAQWDMLLVTTGDEDHLETTLQILPLEVGITAQIPLLTTSGRRYMVLLRAVKGLTSQAGVTWDLGQSQLRGAGPPGLDDPTRPAPGTPRAAPVPEPKVVVTRIHTAWSVEVTKGTPPWEPMTVWDDGEKVIIGFKTSLSFTTAPAVFAVKQGKQVLVESIPWENGDARAPSYYIIPGLQSRLVLVDKSQGQEVQLTRRTGTPAPYREVAHGPVAR